MAAPAYRVGFRGLPDLVVRQDLTGGPRNRATIETGFTDASRDIRQESGAWGQRESGTLVSLVDAMVTTLQWTAENWSGPPRCRAFGRPGPGCADGALRVACRGRAGR